MKNDKHYKADNLRMLEYFRHYDKELVKEVKTRQLNSLTEFFKPHYELCKHVYQTLKKLQNLDMIICAHKDDATLITKFLLEYEDLALYCKEIIRQENDIKKLEKTVSDTIKLWKKQRKQTLKTNKEKENYEEEK